MQRHDAERYEGPVLNVAWGVVRDIFGVFGMFITSGPYRLDIQNRGAFAPFCIYI